MCARDVTLDGTISYNTLGGLLHVWREPYGIRHVMYATRYLAKHGSKVAQQYERDYNTLNVYGVTSIKTLDALTQTVVNN